MQSVAEEDYKSRVAEVQSFVRKRFKGDARIAVIAGSGLGGFARNVEEISAAPFSECPHIGASTVAGHSGKLILGRAAGVPIYLFSGRRHIYEGLPQRDTTLLLRALLAEKRVEIVIISNAAGGLNRCFQVGDLMLISDSINWTFGNPLIGPNAEEWGSRFPDASNLYSKRLREVTRAAAADAKIIVREGIYLAGHGPSYETRAEVAMLRHIHGADAVGMSTVPEALVAAHMDREVLGISFISNLLTEPAATTHEEVMENARLVEGKFARLLEALLPKL